MEQEKTIEEIREEYEKFSKKHNLPDFEKLREDFDIDKLLEKVDGFLIRDVRRTITEKTSAYLHVFETFVNPASPPLFVFSFLKNLTEEDKTKIKQIYKELTRLQIENMKLDTIYDEKTEIEFIKKTFDFWQKLKKDIYSVIERFHEEFEKDVEHSDKSYFG
jgi:hypothetical protein